MGVAWASQAAIEDGHGPRSPSSNGLSLFHQEGTDGSQDAMLKALPQLGTQLALVSLETRYSLLSSPPLHPQVQFCVHGTRAGAGRGCGERQLR